jgi:hypothetical protein
MNNRQAQLHSFLQSQKQVKHCHRIYTTAHGKKYSLFRGDKMMKPDKFLEF